MIVWTTAFLDGPAAGWAATLAHWQAVTAGTLSAFRGPDEEFVTVLPAAGDAFLRAQRKGVTEPLSEQIEQFLVQIAGLSVY